MPALVAGIHVLSLGRQQDVDGRDEPGHDEDSFHLCLMNVPLRSSLTACCSSALVFITIGPYQATGSSIGLPETRRKRMPSSPACTVTSSPRSNTTSDRLPVRSRTRVSPAAVSFSVSTPNGADAAANVPEPSNT